MNTITKHQYETIIYIICSQSIYYLDTSQIYYIFKKKKKEKRLNNVLIVY